MNIFRSFTVRCSSTGPKNGQFDLVKVFPSKVEDKATVDFGLLRIKRTISETSIITVLWKNSSITNGNEHKFHRLASDGHRSSVPKIFGTIAEILLNEKSIHEVPRSRDREAFHWRRFDWRTWTRQNGWTDLESDDLVQGHEEVGLVMFRCLSGRSKYRLTKEHLSGFTACEYRLFLSRNNDDALSRSVFMNIEDCRMVMTGVKT